MDLCNRIWTLKTTQEQKIKAFCIQKQLELEHFFLYNTF